MRKLTGFVLIEVMVVLAILGILLALMLPNYQQHILRSYRLEARQELYRIAMEQQQYYLNYQQYTSALSKLAAPADSYLTVSGRYRIRAALVADGYLLQAEAVGPQIQDSPCQVLLIDHHDVRRSTPAQECWQ